AEVVPLETGEDEGGEVRGLDRDWQSGGKPDPADDRDWRAGREPQLGGDPSRGPLSPQPQHPSAAMPATGLHVLGEGGELRRAPDYGVVARDEGAPAKEPDQKALGDQGGDGPAHGDAAHAEFLAEPALARPPLALLPHPP